VVQAQRRREQRAVPQRDWGEGAYDLQNLRAGQQRLLARQLAPSTAKSYAGQVRLYEEFAVKVYGAPQLTDEGVAFWIQRRAEHKHRLSSIEAGLAALGHVAQAQGLPPPRCSPLVARALKAAARVAPADVQQKLRLTVQLLGGMMEFTEGQRDEWMIVRDKVLFYVGFYGMFRGSELVGIQWQHVHFPRSGGVMVFVPSSKTDPQGAGAWVFIPAAKGAEGALVDVVAALQQLREMQGGRGFVFLARRDQTAPLSKQTVTWRVRKALQGRVRGPSLYATHSLRRGGATHAPRCGVSLRYIMVLGRWRSDVVRQYIYCSGKEAMAAATKMLQEP
jgi:integrase